MEILRSGDISGAGGKFGAASEADPARPWRELGRAREIEAFSYSFGALKKYESIVNLSPDFDSGYTAYCRLALAHGKPHLAEYMARKYAARLAVSYLPAESAPNAEQTVDPALRAFHLMAGRTEIAQGLYDKAEGRLRNLRLSFANDPEVQFALASALLAQDRVDEALETARRENGQKSRAGSLAAVEFYIEANQANSAIEALQDLKNTYSDDIQIDRFIFESYLKLGYPDIADSKISELEKDGAPENVLWILRAQLSENVGEFRRAYNLYLYAHSLEKTNHELYRAAARAIALGHNFVLAEDNMKFALIHIDDGTNSEEYIADAYLDLAEFFLWTRQWKLTLSNIDKAERMFGEKGRLEFMRINALKSILLQDSARAHLALLTARKKEIPAWNLGIAGSFIDLGELDSANVYLDKVLDRFPKNFAALLFQVELRQLAADTALHRQAVEELVDSQPRNQHALKLAIAFTAAAGRLSQSLDLAERLIEYFPGSLSAYQISSRIATQSDGSGAGRRYLQRAIENNPDLPAAYHVLSIDFLRSGQVDSAAAYVAKALELDPDYIPSLLTSGLLLENRNQSDSAISLYRKVIERDPFSAEAFNHLAWAMVESEMNPREAANHAREAINLSGGVNAKMHTTLAWAYHKQGRYDVAKISFMRSTSMEPNDPFKRYLMGINYESLGQPEDALRELNLALELGVKGKYRLLAEAAVLRLGG